LIGVEVPTEAVMLKAQEMRQNAENCLDLAAEANALPERLRYLRMAQAWQALAECQAWLDTDTLDGSVLTPTKQH
jgi:hypothetical protein